MEQRWPKKEIPTGELQESKGEGDLNNEEGAMETIPDRMRREEWEGGDIDQWTYNEWDQGVIGETLDSFEKDIQRSNEEKAKIIAKALQVERKERYEQQEKKFVSAMQDILLKEEGLNNIDGKGLWKMIEDQTGEKFNIQNEYFWMLQKIKDLWQEKKVNKIPSAFYRSYGNLLPEDAYIQDENFLFREGNLKKVQGNIYKISTGRSGLGGVGSGVGMGRIEVEYTVDNGGKIEHNQTEMNDMRGYYSDNVEVSLDTVITKEIKKAGSEDVIVEKITFEEHGGKIYARTEEIKK